MPKDNILSRKKRSKARISFQNNQPAEAEQLYLQILHRNHVDLEALQILGTIVFRQGNLPEAKKYFERAIAVSPKHHELWYQLGCVSDKLGDIDTACKQFKCAIDFKTDFIDARMALGNSEASQGLLGKAKDQYKAVLAIDPLHLVARNNLANVLANQGDIQSALSAWDRVLKQRPDYYSAYSNKLLALNYLTDLSQADIYAQHKTWAEQLPSSVTCYKNHHNDADPHRQLHIAYVSADFREHSVSYFIEAILKHHSRNVFKIYCYSDVTNPDSITEHLFACVDEVRQISNQPDQTVANWILQDKIDILIDLSGHTSGNRLQLFARKPAPIQMTYLGYPNTTGLNTIDYRLTDAVVDLNGDNQQYYTEKLLKIPGGFLCYSPPLNAPNVGALPLRKNGYVTFGIFNNVAKITPEFISVWAKLLESIQNSQMIFKNKSFSDPETCYRYRELFNNNGISSDRLVFSGLTADKQDYLDFYNRVDITLDSYPYNGTTTTFDSLFMGVPTVSLAGDRHASRVGASILHAVGMDKLVARSHQEYIDKATDLALQPDRLEKIRFEMRGILQASSLCDGIRITREIEHIYRDVWSSWCSKKN